MRGHRSPREAVNAFLAVTPPYELGPAAARAGATSMIDVSDGLISDAGHIAAASHVALDFDSQAIAPDEFLEGLAVGLGEDPWRWVLAFGEDHNLLATFAEGADVPEGFRRVGTVRAGDKSVTIDGQKPQFERGHDHFAP
jgi:thiamine-monophosphate kinase